MKKPRSAPATPSPSPNDDTVRSPDPDRDPSRAPTDPDRTEAESVANANAAVDGDGDAAPEAEPLTPERVLLWNRYYDRYVLAFTLALVALVSSNLIARSDIFAHLHLGRVISETGKPILAVDSSITAEGRPWVNVPWLYQVGAYQIYRASAAIAPRFGGVASLLSFGALPRYDEMSIEMQRRFVEQFAGGVLVLVTALIYTLAAALLISIRRPGPGAWWSCVVAILALCGVLFPISALVEGRSEIVAYIAMTGGIAGPVAVSPRAAGLLFLAVELWLIHGALIHGRTKSLFALIPLFLLWVNVDVTIWLGLLILAAALIPVGGLPLKVGLPTLALGAGVTLANPALAGIFSTIPSVIAGPGIFGAESGLLTEESRFGVRALFVVTAAIGLLSFVANRRGFSAARLGMFAVGAVAFALDVENADVYAFVWLATLALNGQEWFLRGAGAEGRVGIGWNLWSTGGRAVTLLAIVALAGQLITGYTSQGLSNTPVFGLGLDRDRMSFDAAEFLRTARFNGKVLNTNASQGDALLWIAEGRIPTVVDNRPLLHTAEDLAKVETLRTGLRDDPDTVREFLDENGVSIVMVPVGYTVAPKRFQTVPRVEVQATRTYRNLMLNPNFLPFYDDGNVVMFGRTREIWVPIFDPIDVAAVLPGPVSTLDARFFAANRLDPEIIVYSRNEVIPTTPRPPASVSANIDSFFIRRFLRASNPRVFAASRHLNRGQLRYGEDRAFLPTLAECHMAIREARRALAVDPDDRFAYLVMNEAYKGLLQQEVALLAGIPLENENYDRIVSIVPPPDLLPLRFAQRLSALNYAIQSSPPAIFDRERAELADLHFQAYQAYSSLNYVDKSLEHLAQVVRLSPPESLNPALLAQYEELRKVHDDILKQIDDAKLEPNMNQITLASSAMRSGMVNVALQELEKARTLNLASAVVHPMLMDLYCQIGQPDGAVTVFGNVGEPNLNTGPGTAPYRQGRYRLLMGDYDSAREFWDRFAIPVLARERDLQALGGAAGFIRGTLTPMIAGFSSQSLVNSVRTQANYEFELATVLLESGRPGEAGDRFVRCLELEPRFRLRPLIAYYLERLGRDVPPLPPDADGESGSESESAAKPDSVARIGADPRLAEGS